jgi:putative glutamine amidotransferase
MKKTNTKPFIGIVPSFDEGNRIPAGGGNIKRIYIRHEYMHLLAQVGAVPLVLNPDMTYEEITELCDGIVLSGGEDIDPTLYGQEKIPQPRRRYIEPSHRYEWESGLINACDKAGVSILGICYGMQRLNVHYGGTLIQDIPTFMPDNIGHDHTTHHITFDHDFLSMKETGVHEINSRHHQAIDRLAEGFTVCAAAPDGIIEAIQGYGHFGMQWHPESDETGAHIYRAFIEGLNQI